MLRFGHTRTAPPRHGPPLDAAADATGATQEQPAGEDPELGVRAGATLSATGAWVGGQSEKSLGFFLSPFPAPLSPRVFKYSGDTPSSPYEMGRGGGGGRVLEQRCPRRGPGLLGRQSCRKKMEQPVEIVTGELREPPLEDQEKASWR